MSGKTQAEGGRHCRTKWYVLLKYLLLISLTFLLFFTAPPAPLSKHDLLIEPDEKKRVQCSTDRRILRPERHILMLRIKEELKTRIIQCLKCDGCVHSQKAK
jgi:hypothetical protein